MIGNAFSYNILVNTKDCDFPFSQKLLCASFCESTLDSFHEDFSKEIHQLQAPNLCPDCKHFRVSLVLGRTLFLGDQLAYYADDEEFNDLRTDPECLDGWWIHCEKCLTIVPVVVELTDVHLVDSAKSKSKKALGGGDWLALKPKFKKMKF